MNIILFILVLGVLVFVHELGHFLFARLFGIRVDEFGFGYPPKIGKLFTWRGTKFTLNWIPFGGFVKIFGEHDDGSELTEEEKSVSLVYKPRWQQMLVMFGGILFNIIFAWILFTGIFMAGVESPVESAPQNYQFDETHLTVVNVLSGSPAAKAGLAPGDIVVQYYHQSKGEISSVISGETMVNKNTLSDFINESGESNQAVHMVIKREQEIKSLKIIPEQNIIENSYAIGIALENVGELKLPFHQALVYGAKNTAQMTAGIVKGFAQLISGNISLDDVSGPVGIVDQVGKASTIGISYLIGFTALLSLNLAVLNLVPFPALDGGRIFILLIESVIRRRLPEKAVLWVNAVGFFILIGFMLLITAKDIMKLFS